MIPFDFEYYRPGAVREAVETFRQLDEAGKVPVWYGGGSELLSMARVGNAAFGAVVDIKDIPECRTIESDGLTLHLGAALTLNDIAVSGKFPLLGKTAGRIADHTMQSRITLGGNLASTIIYRETALPLLLSDAAVTTASVSGLATYSIKDVFKERLKLPRGAFVVGAAVALEYAEAPYFHEKKTKNEKIDYPLITTEALVAGGALRIAFSGFAAYPFRDKGVERILSDASLSFEERAAEIDCALSGAAMTDMNGSAAYRRFVLKNTVINILKAVKEERIPCLC
jgi:CO/xanthine dehydrogenase FAD-binding subunit